MAASLIMPIFGVDPTLFAMVYGLLGASLPAWSRYREGTAETHENRQRVRDAESILEAALRRQVEHTSQTPIRVWTPDGMATNHPHGESTNGVPSWGGPADELPSTKQHADLTLPALWAVTHARLAEYHGTAVGQAKRAFRNAQYAMGAGFVLLAAFVYAAFHAKSATGSAIAGALGAVAAALSGYIAKTFIKSQEMTSEALHRYFEEPLVLSRYLAAERLVRDAGISEDKQADLLRTIVHSMITGESLTPVPSPRAPEPGNE